MLNKDLTGRISDLLAIVEKVAGVAPSMMSISGEAMSELKEINDKIAADAQKALPPGQYPGMPTTPAPDPSPPAGPKAVPSQTFEDFNSKPLPNKLPSGADNVEG